MSRRVELDIGRRFGMLTVAAKIAPATKKSHPRWKCVCDCGGEITLQAGTLLNGSKSTCGCWFHGNSKTPSYKMLYDARKRARVLGIECTIEPEDVTTPEICPVLGIRLSEEGHKDLRPSLDRIDPCRGYTPENVCVISFRANRIKSNASLDELRRIVEYVDRHTPANDNTNKDASLAAA